MVDQATSWNLEEALQLFYLGNEAGSMAAPQPPTENASNLAEQSSGLVDVFFFASGVCYMIL